MPIIAKSELARRAAARAAAADAAKVERSTPPAKAVVAEPPTYVPREKEEMAPSSADLPSTSPKGKQRGHATKDENGKWQPTANYANGFARPPEHSRFKPGGKPGPGRPKGSVSHDALFAKHLTHTRNVSMNGRRQRLANRELVIISTINSALDGKDKKARTHVLAQDQRLFPPKEVAENTTSASTLSASDALSLAEFEEEIRERLRQELRAERDTSEGEGQ